MISLLQMGRGIAALLVVLFHASLATRASTGSNSFSALSFGWSGVQFFFVLSGFIIFRTHRGDIGHSKKLSSYLYKRAVRIYPLYWVVTLALLPVWMMAPSEPYDDNVLAALMSLLLLPQVHHPHLTVAWTLVHEVTFYTLFAVTIVDRRGLWLLGIWFIAIVTANLSGTLDFPASFFLSINNLLFGFGILAAAIIDRVRAGLAALAAGVLIFSLGAYADVAGLAREADRLLILIFGLGAFLIVLSSKSPRIERWSDKAGLLFIGDASYSIYLAHYPAISIVCKILTLFGGEGAIMTFAFSVMGGLGAGVFLYLFVEKPLLMLLRRSSRQSALADSLDTTK